MEPVKPLLYCQYMSKEQKGRGIPITAIHIDLKARCITFAAEEQTVAKLTLAPEGVIFFQPGHKLEHVEALPATIDPGQPVPEAESGVKETELRATVTGRLKVKPRPGRPDRSGKPTAFARFAAHEEGQDKAHDYIATFHRHTTRIALGLAKDAQITVDGYPHPSTSEKRLDTLSVINIVNYPGKPRSK